MSTTEHLQQKLSHHFHLFLGEHPRIHPILQCLYKKHSTSERLGGPATILFVLPFFLELPVTYSSCRWEGTCRLKMFSSKGLDRNIHSFSCLGVRADTLLENQEKSLSSFFGMSFVLCSLHHLPWLAIQPLVLVGGVPSQVGGVFIPLYGHRKGLE